MSAELQATEENVEQHLLSGRLVIASHNEDKVQEIDELLHPCGVDVVSAGDLGLDEPEETGTTFEANALLKARAACRASNLPALADDSGLVVAALDGQPGLHSARWAGPGRDFMVAMSRVDQELRAKSLTRTEDRAAYFISVLCLAWPDGSSRCFEGRVYGHLTWPPRGDKGFGYDPMFLPEDRDQTFGEMAAAVKHSLSHRARAFEKLVAAMFPRT